MQKAKREAAAHYLKSKKIKIKKQTNPSPQKDLKKAKRKATHLQKSLKKPKGKQPIFEKSSKLTKVWGFFCFYHHLFLNAEEKTRTLVF